MNDKYCVHCFDDASLRKIFEETSSKFLKSRTTKKIELHKNGNQYEIWQDFKPNEELMLVWGEFYCAVRNSIAGLRFYNEMQLLKRVYWKEVQEGEGI